LNETTEISGRKRIFSWCMYDWANSAFTTLVVTFIYATYFTTSIAQNEIIGTTQWSWGIGVSAVLIALLSPVFGAIADRGGRRRRYLIVSTVICVGATALLTFIAPGSVNAVLLSLTVFVIANVAFEIGMVFYNAFLPEITPQEKIGRVSGYGWGLGYMGGLFCLVAALAVFVPDTPLFGISTADGFNIRATNLLVAGWFLLFSLPMFAFVKDCRPAHERASVRDAFGDLATTFRQVRGYREIVRFLLARLFYNDALVTVFAFGGIYAMGTFNMTFEEMTVWAITINAAAGLGAFAMGFLDDRIGGKRTALLSIVMLAAAATVAVLTTSTTLFWIAGIVIGVAVGPNQAASRSLMGRFVPPRHKAEFFGFFAFSGKITSFTGPILLGLVTAATGSQRAGMSTILLFLLVGGLLLLTVDERKGMAEATQAS
jgi:UMF1 family MFS transporter